VRTVDDFRAILLAGADKVAANTAAVENPGLITQAAEKFGSQCVVIAVDAKRDGSIWRVYTHGGRTPTQRDAVEWVREAEALGAGEILLTSMDRDGTRDGYEIELTRAVADSVSIPVIASGGAGRIEHFAEALIDGHADAALAASLFHFGELTIAQVKDYVEARGVTVRR
jgi:cyclase